MSARNIIKLIFTIILLALIAFSVVWAIVNSDTLLEQTSSSQQTEDQNSNQEPNSANEDPANSNPGPVIEDLTPGDSYTTSEERITLQGTAEEGASVSINDQEIQVDEDGKFSQDVVLELGTNRITVSTERDGLETNYGLILFRRNESSTDENSNQQNSDEQSNDSDQNADNDNSVNQDSVANQQQTNSDTQNNSENTQANQTSQQPDTTATNQEQAVQDETQTPETTAPTGGEEFILFVIGVVAIYLIFILYPSKSKI